MGRPRDGVHGDEVHRDGVHGVLERLWSSVHGAVGWGTWRRGAGDGVHGAPERLWSTVHGVQEDGVHRVLERLQSTMRGDGVQGMGCTGC